jgi:hypothetical protein
MTYHIVFESSNATSKYLTSKYLDVSTVGFEYWPTAALCLILLTASVFILFKREALRASWRISRGASVFIAVTAFAVSAVWALVLLWQTYQDYRRPMLSIRAVQPVVRVVEGPVEAFVPMPVSGHAMEKFCVQSECFEYSDYVLTEGFNNTSSHGGPIKPGLPVRIAYVDRGTWPRNLIVKLEVAD